MHDVRRAFTLIEILVVVAIIVLLASVLLVSFTDVFGRSEEAQARATIETLKSNVQSYESRWGIPPPANLGELGALVGYNSLTDPNTANRGIETLVLALRSRREQGPYIDTPLFADDARRTNLDGDTAVEGALAPEFLDVDTAESRELFEIVDPWGNPFVYLDVKSIQNGSFEYTVTMADGTTEKLDVTETQNALRHPTTGAYPTSFVLWSFGPDGVNDYGRGDDITSWPKYE